MVPEPETAAHPAAVSDSEPDFLELLDVAGVDAGAWAGLDDGRQGLAAELVVRDRWPVEEALRIATGETIGSA